jgi:MFS superfamily sulfate permease-like transporter
VAKKLHLRTELIGGIEAALQGFVTTIGPILLFLGLFGPGAISAGYWAALITASGVHGVSLFFRGQRAFIPSARTASLTAYAALVLHMAFASGGATAHDGGISAEQLRTGLAAGSLMFLASGILVSLAGMFQLGNLFKMIPTPVTAGISNGTALLMVWLAARQMQHGQWSEVITGLVMLLVYLAWPRVQARAQFLLLIPAVLASLGLGLLSTFLLEPDMFSLKGHLTQSPLDWFAISLWPELMRHDLGRMLAIGLPGVITLALVMILETFTTTSVMHARFDVQVDANRELVVMGASNMFSAVVGGVPSTGSSVRSVASWAAGGRGLGASLTCMSVNVGLLLTLSSWLLALPAGLVAGLFLTQAIVLTDKAFFTRATDMVRSRRLRSGGALDLGFLITLVISLVAFFGNLVWACAVGVGLSCLVVLRRLSENLTAQWAYLYQYSSRRVRSPQEREALSQGSHGVAVLRLTGHLFFGNSVRLTQLVDELHADVVAVVVDISEVSDADSSGLDAVAWVIRTLVARHLMVVITGLNWCKSTHLGEVVEPIFGTKHCVDLDRGLQLCEELVLKNAAIPSAAVQTLPLAQNSLLRGLDEDEVTAVLMLGDMRTIPEGSGLFRRDAPSDGLWLLEQGVVSILSFGGGAESRLATVGPGQFVGEMGFIDGKPRSATAQADTPVRALLLDQAGIHTLLLQHPAVALKITRNIAHELSGRVRTTSAIWMDGTNESAAWANSSLGKS